MARRKKSRKVQWKKQLSYELIGIFLLALSCITLAKLGVVGQVLVHLFRFFFGEWYIVLTIALLITALYMMVKREVPKFWSRRLAGGYLIIFSFLLLSHLKLFQLLSAQGEFVDPSVIRNTWELYWLQAHGEIAGTDLGGGMIGAFGFAASHLLFDYVGTQIFAFVLIITGIILITGRSLTDMLIHIIKKVSGAILHFAEKIKVDFIQWKDEWKAGLKDRIKETKKTRKKREQAVENHEIINENANEDQSEPISEPIISDFTTRVYTEEEQLSLIEPSDLPESKDQDMKGDDEGEESEDTNARPDSLINHVETNEHYLLPPLELLSTANPNGQQHMQQHILAKSNIQKLEKTFESFGVKVKIPKVHLGPAVTKYEVYPSVGVKVSKIVNLADDLALALAAKDIRIEAPIPGKSAVGIEVPNQEVAIVTLREVIESSENKKDSSKLLIGLGRDISGEPVLAELNKMPHLLVAGATGSGKSVCINGIITSILMRAKPHEVKLMMIDPKMVELNVYNGIPHLLTPVVTEPKKASQALKKIVNEMERRYDLFSHTGTRNIEGYNTLIDRENEGSPEKQGKLPYIVVIVDELADLMMVASGDVEDAITRLAQMARAAGIHLIIATQRPSVDVITGVIKANIPSRIAFGVSSQTDSRTILDMGGAEKLLGRGDMLFLPVGASKPVRIQGAFLSDEEVEKIVHFVISQQKAQYQEEMTPTEEKYIDTEVKDELYQDAVDLVVEMETASVSMLQRRFRIGYTRAARLIDEMEARGVVGPYEGSKPREVLLTKQVEDASSS